VVGVATGFVVLKCDRVKTVGQHGFQLTDHPPTKSFVGSLSGLHESVAGCRAAVKLPVSPENSLVRVALPDDAINSPLSRRDPFKRPCRDQRLAIICVDDAGWQTGRSSGRSRLPVDGHYHSAECRRVLFSSTRQLLRRQQIYKTVSITGCIVI